MVFFSLLYSGWGWHHLCHPSGSRIPEATEAVCGGGSPPSDHYQSFSNCHQSCCQQNQGDLCFRQEGRQEVRAWRWRTPPLLSANLKWSGLLSHNMPFLSQRAEAAVGEMCRHSPELQADRGSKGLLLKDGCGCCDVSGGTDVSEDDWHQESPGRSPWGESVHSHCLLQ